MSRIQLVSLHKLNSMLSFASLSMREIENEQKTTQKTLVVQGHRLNFAVLLKKIKKK